MSQVASLRIMGGQFLSRPRAGQREAVAPNQGTYTGPIISLRNVNRSFRSATGEVVEVLRGLNLDVEPGSFNVIRGESGSGKTTLLRVLGLLDSDFEGDYLFGGEWVNGNPEWMRDEIRANNIGFIFQDGRLFDHLSMRENIAIPVRLRGTNEQRSTINQSLAGMAVRFFTERTDDILASRPASASGGQKQRASIMRAVINKPAVILADEPTASLDESRKKNILELLESLCTAGHTVIVVSHDKVFYDTGRQLELKSGRLEELAPSSAVPVSRLPVRRPQSGPSLLFGWRPKAPLPILISQAARETFGRGRRIFLFLILISLCVGVSQIGVFSSVIIGVRAFVDDAMTKGSRLNRLQIKPRNADLAKENRFPVADAIRSWANVELVVARRQTIARLVNIQGATTPYVAMGLHPEDPEYQLLDFAAGGPFSPGNDELEIILTAGLLNDLFDTSELADGSSTYADFIGKPVTLLVPRYTGSGNLLDQTPVKLRVQGIILHAEGGRQVYLPNITQLVFDQIKMDRSGDLKLPLNPAGDAWVGDRADVHQLANFPWEDQLHVYSTEMREIIPVFQQLSRSGYKPQSDIWDFKWALDVQDIAWNIFIPLLVLIIIAAAVTVVTSISSSAKLREREFALWRILGMRRGDLVATQVISTAFMVVAGSAIGLVIAWLLVNGARRFLAGQHSDTNVEMVFAPVTQFALLILVLAMLVGILSAIYPAVRTANVDPAKLLQS